MAGRPVDYQRRSELLDAIVDYVDQHGFADLSWRPIAAALDVSTTTLVHHFGSKDQLLIAILRRLRERILAATNETPGAQNDLVTSARAAWVRTSDPQRGAEFRLFFTVYGHALQEPEFFAEFIDHVVGDWMNVLLETQGPDIDPVTAKRRATLVIATLRGLLLDLLTTGDRDRANDAAESFFATLTEPAGGKPSG